MAISTNDYNDLQREDKGLLEISANDFYFDKVRPHMEDILLTCKDDPELIRTLEKIINAGDSYCVRKEYDLLLTSFDAYTKVVSGPNYFSRIIKNATEENKNKIRALTVLFSDLTMIIKCEKPAEFVETEAPERLDYNSPIGGIKGDGYNNGHAEHNMKKLSEPNPKQRIPNV